MNAKRRHKITPASIVIRTELFIKCWPIAGSLKSCNDFYCDNVGCEAISEDELAS